MTEDRSLHLDRQNANRDRRIANRGRQRRSLHMHRDQASRTISSRYRYAQRWWAEAEGTYQTLRGASAWDGCYEQASRRNMAVEGRSWDADIRSVREREAAALGIEPALYMVNLAFFLCLLGIYIMVGLISISSLR